MGRSQETFSKKENEKKKQKKRKDKEEKKEERKANSSKGQGLDSMLVYLDENGNFTDTPPDPKVKRKQIAQEDIQIGIARQEDVVMDVIRTGIVTFFNESKGYGFIKDSQTQESVFVHVNGLIDAIKENNKVTFETENSPKGLTAIKVKKAL